MLSLTAGALAVAAPGETVLKVGDRVIVMGLEDELEKIRPASVRGTARR